MITPNTITVEIAANDDEHGVIMLDPSQASPVYINEDQSSPRAVLSMRREGGTFGEVSIKYSISDQYIFDVCSFLIIIM